MKKHYTIAGTKVHRLIKVVSKKQFTENYTKQSTIIWATHMQRTTIPPIWSTNQTWYLPIPMDDKRIPPVLEEVTVDSVSADVAQTMWYLPIPMDDKRIWLGRRMGRGCAGRAVGARRFGRVATTTSCRLPRRVKVLVSYLPSLRWAKARAPGLPLLPVVAAARSILSKGPRWFLTVPSGSRSEFLSESSCINSTPSFRHLKSFFFFACLNSGRRGTGTSSARKSEKAEIPNSIHSRCLRTCLLLFILLVFFSALFMS